LGYDEYRYHIGFPMMNYIAGLSLLALALTSGVSLIRTRRKRAA